MASTTFTDNITPIAASWLNDVNSATYTILGNGTSYTGVLTLAGTTDSTSTTTGMIINAGGAGIAKALWVGGLANIAGAVTLQNDLAVNGGDLTTSATTFNLLNTTATTVNFAGGASTALNIGHASGTNTVLGATTFSQTMTAAAINTSDSITGTRANSTFVANPTTAAAILGHFEIKRSGTPYGYIGLNASDKPSLIDSAGTERLQWNTTGVTVTGTLGVTGAVTTNGGLQTFGANDSGGAGYRLVLVPNA